MPLIKQFLPYAKEKMGFKDPPRLFLRGDEKNATNPLGKTGFYDPEAKSITLYVTGRHPKDVMRSLSHELVHHTQCCNGQFDDVGEMGEGYAQSDDHLREMEREAYETGNMCFRDWEDSIKSTIYFEHLQKGENKMSTKDWKNKEISQLLSEAWGFKFSTLQEFDEFNGKGEVQEEATDADAEVQEEGADDAEVQEEGGAAARTGNEDKDVGRDRMHADRVHEGEEEEVVEEGCPAEEEEEVVEEDTTSRMDKLRRTRGGVEAEEEDEEDEEDLKEAIKTLLGKYLKG